jgi:hypothetical protein
MLADHLLCAIDGARTAELAQLGSDISRAYANGTISEDDHLRLWEAIQERRTRDRVAAAGKQKNAPRASARRPRRPQPPREKLFGNGRLVPLDREAKNRIQVLMRALTHPTEPGKHYGAVTAKAEAVGRVLLWVFHNAGTGRCFPSYEAIAKAADCNRDTVAEAIKMLEAAGILTWCNRRARVRIGGATKVIRTSNSYRFIDPGSKSEFPSGTKNQDHLSLKGQTHREVLQAQRTEARPPWGIPHGVFPCERVS